MAAPRYNEANQGRESERSGALAWAVWDSWFIISPTDSVSVETRLLRQSGLMPCQHEAVTPAAFDQQKLDPGLSNGLRIKRHQLHDLEGHIHFNRQAQDRCFSSRSSQVDLGQA